LEIFKPEYNLLKTAGSPLGRRHSEETKEKMINAQNSGRFKKGQQRSEGAGTPSQQISVFDKNKNETTIYDSIREAARVLDIPNSSIRRNLKTGSLYKFRYIFNKV